MKIIEVTDTKTAKLFHDAAREVYKNDNVWVCPLDQTVENVFHPETNVFFNNGEAIRWIATANDGKLLGRVAAFINQNKAYGYDQPTGGMGFFECINDQEVAFALFDTCKNWLSKKGMEAMDGPINFGENDNFWGLLVEGFTHPSFGMQYHLPYYKELFESYGFKFYFEQVSNLLDLKKPFPERFWKIADWVRQKPGYSFEHFSLKNAEKYIDDLKYIYDTAWVFHENFTPLQKEDLEGVLKNAKGIIDEEMIWFAYFEGEPIAFLVMFPDVNQILKHLGGKMNFCNMLKFLWLKKKHTITRARITIMGVVPKFQKSGIESAIFWHLDKAMKRKPWYTEIELSWVGDFNPKMRALHESVGAVFAKRHLTYRKLFSDTNTYHRSTVIPMDTKEKALKETDKKD